MDSPGQYIRKCIVNRMENMHTGVRLYKVTVINIFLSCLYSEMYTVLMAVCAVPGNKPEDQVLTCVELLVERNARVNVYDK